MTAMMLKKRTCLAVLVALALTSGSASAQVVLARYPHGTYLENLMADADGSVLVTNYFSRTIERWAPGVGASTFKTLDVLPVSLAPAGDDILVVAHTTTFDKIGSTPNANVVLLMSRTGEVKRRIAMPQAAFLNAVEPLGGGRYLIADSILGRIWSFDLASGDAKVWLEDDRLMKLPNSASPNPGANGVRLSPDGVIYISNSERRLIARIGIDAQGAPSGVLETFVDNLPGVDDFAFDADGAIVFATHQHQIMRLGKDKSLTELSGVPEVAGATSVVIGKGPSAGGIFVAGTGGLFEGGKGEAALVRLR